MSLHGLSRLSWDIAFGVYVQANAQATPALAYCRLRGADNMPFCKEVLERRFLAEDLETINSIVDAKGDWSTKNKGIQQHLVEYQVHEWISQINLTNGVAPSYEDVFDKYKEVRQKVGMDPPNYEVYRNRKNGCNDLCRSGNRREERCRFTKQKTKRK